MKQLPSDTVEIFGLRGKELERHLQKDAYGDFRLTNAIRPCPSITPTEGFRFDECNVVGSTHKEVVLIASVSREKLLDVFMSMLEPLTEPLDVYITSSHNRADGSHVEVQSSVIERIILQSKLYDVEDIILHDGCTGIGVVDHNLGQEVRFDEHKLLLAYTHVRSRFGAFVSALSDHDILQNDDMQCVIDGPHVHASSTVFEKKFFNLAVEFGAEMYEEE